MNEKLVPTKDGEKSVFVEKEISFTSEKDGSSANLKERNKFFVRKAAK